MRKGTIALAACHAVCLIALVNTHSLAASPTKSSSAPAIKKSIQAKPRVVPPKAEVKWDTLPPLKSVADPAWGPDLGQNEHLDALIDPGKAGTELGKMLLVSLKERLYSGRDAAGLMKAGHFNLAADAYESKGNYSQARQALIADASEHGWKDTLAEFYERNLNFAEAYKIYSSKSGSRSLADFWKRQKNEVKYKELLLAWEKKIREAIADTEKKTGGKSYQNQWRLLAVAQNDLGQTAEALKAATAGVPLSLPTRALIYEESGDLSKAEADLKQNCVDKGKQLEWQTVAELAMFYIRTDQIDKGIEQLKQMVGKPLFPTDQILKHANQHYKQKELVPLLLSAKGFSELLGSSFNAEYGRWSILAQWAKFFDALRDSGTVSQLNKVLTRGVPNESDADWFKAVASAIQASEPDRAQKYREIGSYLEGNGLPLSAKYIAWDSTGDNRMDVTPQQDKLAVVNPPARNATDRPIGDKWAVIVGVGKFKDPTIPQLKYPSKDARDFYNFLISKANFAPDHVRLLTDEKATRQRIWSEIGDRFLPRVVAPDDLVILYFSTHGTPMDRDVRNSSYLVAYDTPKSMLYADGIEMQKIVDELQRRTSADRVLVILDACHSGAADPNAKSLDFHSQIDAEQLVMGKGNIVLSSSQPKERSWESKNYPNGIFTKKLIEQLSRDPRILAGFEGLKDSVSDEVRQEFGESQLPRIKADGWEGKDLLINAPPTKSRVISDTVKNLLEPDSSAQQTLPQ